MTMSSRLAIAPVVAFAVAFAVVLALGQLVATPPTAPTPPSTASPVVPPPTELGGAKVATVESDATGGIKFGPLDPGTFAGPGLSVRVDPLDGRKVRVCVTTSQGTTIEDPGWKAQGGGTSCAVVRSGSYARVHLEPAS